MVGDLAAISKGDFSTPRFGGLGGSGMGPFDSAPMGSYWLPIDTYGLSLTVSACSSDPDTMTNTALEAIASSSGKSGKIKTTCSMGS